MRVGGKDMEQGVGGSVGAPCAPLNGQPVRLFGPGGGGGGKDE